MRRTFPNIFPPETLSGLEHHQQPLPAGLWKRLRNLSDAGNGLSSPVQVSFTLPLECITPVVGGGVESREPDAVDGLRIQGIRGQLRMWWRAFQTLDTAQNGHPSSGHSPAKILFEREAELWGGVGLERDSSRRSNQTDALKSQVQLSLSHVQRGQDIPAGRYKGERGNYHSLPSWDGGSAMGYGLFPLQLKREELNSHTMAAPPTRSVRRNLRFDLNVSVSLTQNRAAADPVGCLRETVGALWLWVHLGGVGGRTTRGFGALSLRLEDLGSVPSFTVLCLEGGGARAAGMGEAKNPSEHRKNISESGKKISADGKKTSEQEVETPRQAIDKALGELLGLFQPPGSRPEQLGAWFSTVFKIFGWPTAGGLVQGFHPRLPAKALLCGSRRSSAQDALVEGLSHLKEFRQGPGVGRARGTPRPGRSHWPEANTLRRIAIEKRRARFHKHAPSQPDDHRLNGVPRAAFGLPLNTPFKDQEDKLAEGIFLPVSGERWTSPLRMRPLRCKDGYVSLMVYLRQPFPPDSKDAPNESGSRIAGVLVKMKSRNPPKEHPEVEQSVTIKSWEGAKEPIQSALKRTQGDAVLAFLEGLQRRGYQRVEVTS